jgi:hypothetical protein
MEITKKRALTIAVAFAIAMSIVLAAVIIANAQPKTVSYMGNDYEISSLSPETVEWLAWFNALSAEEQMMISYVPNDLVSSGVIMYMGKAYQVDSLSPDTIEWLTWFNALSAEEQMMISYVPSDLTEENAAVAEETNTYASTAQRPAACISVYFSGILHKNPR